jgi:nucleotide-binding universal stress UspA family protein
MYRHVLVPLDGSRLAESVLPIVERLARASGLSVFLLHVLERGAPAAVHGDRHLRAVGEAAEYLRGVADRLQAAGIAVEFHAHEAAEGDVVRSIAEHAEEEGADLIVLCTHGSGRMRERLFGSIAQRVLGRGTTPVLLVRPAADGGAAPFEPRTILVPLDGTEAAEAALRPAGELADQLGTQLHLVMVVATQDTTQRDRATATLFPAATRAVLDLEETDASRYLEELAVRLRSRGLTVTTEVRRGSAASALVAEAAEPGVGLVVLATHGRAGVQAIWAGSVTAQLLMRTSAPVLLLRRVEA